MMCVLSLKAHRASWYSELELMASFDTLAQGFAGQPIPIQHHRVGLMSYVSEEVLTRSSV